MISVSNSSIFHHHTKTLPLAEGFLKKSVAKFKNCGNKTGIKIIIFKSLKILIYERKNF